MKENTDCTIVADLMTLSLDGLTSEESEQLIQEHIQTCKKCLRYKENLIQERQEKERNEWENDRGIIKMLKRWRYVFLGFWVGGATLFALRLLLLYFAFFGGPAKVTRDIGKYEAVLSQPYIQTAYIVFPQTIPEGVQETEFYSYYRDTFGSPTVQTYLKCTYNEQSYAEEIKRLENTSKIYGDEKKVLLRDDSKKYQYPAYIAVENAAHKYEYALLTGEKEITYIFTDYIEIENVKFSKDYLPNDYMTEEGRFFGSGYSIYYESVSTSGIATDYTR